MKDYRYFRAKSILKETLSGKPDDVLVSDELEAARQRFIKSNSRGPGVEKAKAELAATLKGTPEIESPRNTQFNPDYDDFLMILNQANRSPERARQHYEAFRDVGFTYLDEHPEIINPRPAMKFNQTHDELRAQLHRTLSTKSNVVPGNREEAEGELATSLATAKVRLADTLAKKRNTPDRVGGVDQDTRTPVVGAFGQTTEEGDDDLEAAKSRLRQTLNRKRDALSKAQREQEQL